MMKGATVIRPHPALSMTAWPVPTALSLCHLTNDVIQPMLAARRALTAAQVTPRLARIGVLRLAFQATASLFQPVIGTVTNRQPQPRPLPFGMAAMLCGVVLLGIGSAVCPPRPRNLVAVQS